MALALLGEPINTVVLDQDDVAFFRWSVLIQQEHRSKTPVCFGEDAEVKTVTDGVGRQQVAAEVKSRIVVASMLFAHIPPIATDVSAYIGQRVEQILSDQRVHTAGEGQGAEGKSWLEGGEGGHGDTQILCCDGAAYISKVERFDG